MNKKMRELLAQIEEKTKVARGFMDGENKDVDKAAATMDEIDALKKEYETEKRLYEMTKDEEIPEEKAEGAKKARTFAEALKAFGRAAKAGFKTNDYDGTLNESVNADGAYTVPEDIQTRVNELREAEFSFLSLVRKEKVKTATGARTFKKRSQHTGFSKVGEAGAIGATNTPKFERLTWAIEKYAGYMPITNELRYDSDANIANVVIDWLAAESRATANKLILAAINTKSETNLEDLDGIKKALNVTLGSIFKSTSKIVTNDDGLNYLDTLKDNDGKYLLSKNPSDPMKLQLAAGATTVPVEVVPNVVWPSTPTYSASTDTSVDSTKTYYTLSNGVYTAVESPTGNPSTSSYYEMDPTAKIPFVIGDLNEGVVYWDRQLMSIAESAVASIGNFNAYEQDLTLYRAIEREDVTLRDTEAFVRGYIQPAVSGE